jgi:hypothetical protein
VIARPSRFASFLTLAVVTTLASLTLVSTGPRAGAAASTTTTTVPQPLTLTANGRANILVIGDSLGTDLAGGLGWQLSKSKEISLIQKGKSSTGLSNSQFFNWPQHLKKYLAQYHPQLTIVFLGGNDEQGIEANGHPYAFNTPGWRTQYTKAVATMMNESVNAGSDVLWVGMPIMFPNGYRQGMQVINSIFASVASKKSHVTFLPTWKFFASSNGQFRFNASVNGSVQLIRESDGIHPSAVGQNVLATYIVKQLHLIYGLHVAAAYPEVFT